ncbi:MAG: hypothetical protein M1830_006896, partial [Pleopsidium flavum]
VTTRSGTKRKTPPLEDYETTESPHKRSGHCPSRFAQGNTVRSASPSHAIYTIGHGTRTLDELIAILQTADVGALVDIRSIPRSRTNPQFNRDELTASSSLEKKHISYQWMGDTLGGRRNAHQPNIAQHTALRVAAFRNYAGYMTTDSFRQGLQSLKELSREVGRRKKTVAIMCSETLWWRCHRRMVADQLVSDAWAVKHLGVKKGEAPAHTRWDISRIAENGVLIYDEGN